jgi:hypothetical protein
VIDCCVLDFKEVEVLGCKLEADLVVGRPRFFWGESPISLLSSSTISADKTFLVRTVLGFLADPSLLVALAVAVVETPGPVVAEAVEEAFTVLPFPFPPVVVDFGFFTVKVLLDALGINSDPLSSCCSSRSTLDGLTVFAARGRTSTSSSSSSSITILDFFFITPLAGCGGCVFFTCTDGGALVLSLDKEETFCGTAVLVETVDEEDLVRGLGCTTVGAVFSLCCNPIAAPLSFCCELVGVATLVG